MADAARFSNQGPISRRVSTFTYRIGFGIGLRIAPACWWAYVLYDGWLPMLRAWWQVRPTLDAGETIAAQRWAARVEAKRAAAHLTLLERALPSWEHS